MSTHRHEAKLDVAVLHQKVVNVIVICAHKSIYDLRDKGRDCFRIKQA